MCIRDSKIYKRFDATMAGKRIVLSAQIIVNFVFLIRDQGERESHQPGDTDNHGRICGDRYIHGTQSVKIGGRLIAVEMCIRDRYIVGRMGVPYRPKDISVISVILDAPQERISALSGKLGMLEGVSSKTVYSKLPEKSL